MKKKRLYLLALFIISILIFLSGCSLFNQAPSAEFTADPTSGTPPLEVSFDASDSSDPDGEIVSYSWDFDDGETGTGENVSHTFESEGDYDVTLTVTDDDGDIATHETAIEVTPQNQPPTASYTTTTTDESAPFDVDFDASNSSDPDGTIESYEWSLGDGDTASGETVTHTYDSSGDYDIQLTVTDDEGASTVASSTLSLPATSNQNPDAEFTADPTSGTAPLEVSFDASDSSDTDGTIESYSWDFDDGNTGSGQTVSHTFDTGDEYDVTLTVTDDDGGQAKFTTTIVVDPGNPPIP